MSSERTARKKRGSRSFPIPMRGNEKKRRTHIGRTCRKFPIPMRGNEETSLEHVNDVWRVSDPHEG